MNVMNARSVEVTQLLGILVLLVVGVWTWPSDCRVLSRRSCRHIPADSQSLPGRHQWEYTDELGWQRFQFWYEQGGWS